MAAWIIKLQGKVEHYVKLLGIQFPADADTFLSTIL